MKIAIDAHFLSKISQGTGTYSFQLLNALQEELCQDDLIYLLNKENITSLFDNPQYKWGKVFSNKTPINVLFGFMKIMRDVDIIHTNYLCPLFSPIDTKRIITIHDILFKTHRQFFPNKLSWGVDLLTHSCLQRANMIISVSNYTRDMLIKYYPFVREKCEVIYEAPSNDFHVLKDEVTPKLKKWNITRQYILFVGRFAPMKNIDKLIDIYSEDARISKEYDLVLVGKFDSSFPNDKLKEALNKNQKIKVLSGITNVDLNVLYNAATLLYFVSNGEGFGLPILEAMAAGCPVLTSNTTACKEIASHAAILANPQSIDDIHSQMDLLLSSCQLREELRYKGLEHSSKFSWQKCARETYEIYKIV